jgi:hypothetical protein
MTSGSSHDEQLRRRREEIRQEQKEYTGRVAGLGCIGCLVLALLVYGLSRIPESVTNRIGDLAGETALYVLVTLFVLVMGMLLVVLPVVMITAGALEYYLRSKAQMRGWPRLTGEYLPWQLDWPRWPSWGRGAGAYPAIALFGLLPKRIWRRLPAYEEIAVTPLLDVPNHDEALVRTLILLWTLDRQWSPAEHEKIPRLLRWRMRRWEDALHRQTTRPSRK